MTHCPVSELVLEQIDRIERDIELIHANLDRGDRLIRCVLSFFLSFFDLLQIECSYSPRGIESFGGYLQNKFTSADIKGGPTQQERKVNGTLKIKRCRKSLT